MTTASVSYLLCLATALLCAALLSRAYLRQRSPLLFWAACCFAGLSLTNALVVVDLLLLPGRDLYLWRLGVSLGSMLLLLFGMVWEAADER